MLRNDIKHQNFSLPSMGIQLKPGIAQPALILAALCLCLLPARSASTDTTEQSKYIGPGSCAATSCHGSVKPVAGSRIYQNEYSTWILQDKHSRAYGALTGDVGERMARILKLENKAEAAPRCRDMADLMICERRQPQVRVAQLIRSFDPSPRPSGPPAIRGER